MLQYVAVNGHFCVAVSEKEMSGCQSLTRMHAQPVPYSYGQALTSGKGVPIEESQWNTRAVSYSYGQAADGASGRTGDGFRTNMRGGFCGFSGGHHGQGEGQDWAYGTRPQI